MRNTSSNCNPPVFPLFTATMRVSESPSGNLGIVVTQAFEGAGGTTLAYSQFEQSAVTGGLRLSSGQPVRSIGGVDYTTHLDVTFIGRDFSGTETFTRVNPPCTDSYSISGSRQ
jgi:hypothetical protein